MDPSYETVVDPSTIVWTLSAMVIHVAMMATQVGLIVYLIVTGLLAKLSPGSDSPRLRRLGLVHVGGHGAGGSALARVGLGVALMLPLALGAPVALSLASSLAAIALLISQGRRLPAESLRPGRLARGLAIGSAAVLTAFTAWEGEDALALGAELTATAQGWRMHELDWQLSNDVRTPKVGDVAPDFELQDPTGAVAVRLSDFRGKRPVALVFGSYT